MKTWRLNLLRELVLPSDIPFIQSLRPTRTPQAASYCWNLTKSGVYLVKSGYELAMESVEPAEPDQVLEPSITSLQARVWKLKTTKKIKHFIWQAITDCVPVCDALSNRHCGNGRSCPKCGANEKQQTIFSLNAPLCTSLGFGRHTALFGIVPVYLNIH